MSLLNVQSNSDIAAEEEAQRAVDLEARQSQSPIPDLAAYVRRCFEAAAQARRPIEDRMVECLRRRRGEYPPEDLEAIHNAGPSEIYMKITDVKCHAALAWLEDILLAPGDKPWGIKPTPDPDIPPEGRQAIAMEAAQQATAAYQRGQLVTPQDVQNLARQIRDAIVEQTAKAAARENERLECKIEDVLDEGGFREAFKDFLDNLVTFPAAVFKGPVWEMRQTLSWEPGNPVPVVEEKPILVFKSPSPFDIFPAPLATTVDDGYLCERHSLTRRDLAALKGIEGYDSDAIDAVLEDYGLRGLDDWSSFVDPTRRRDLEDKSNTIDDPEGRIAAVQFWGWIQGQQLLDAGMDDTQVPDPLVDYAAEIWVIGRYVIKTELNGDPMGRRPYCKSSIRPRPGSFWGEGLPEIVADCQDMANSSARALCNNEGISSGPQVGVDIGQFAEGEKVEELRPWKVWQFDMARNQTTRPPMWFFQPQSQVVELLRIFEFFSNAADETSGIPKYLGGNNPKGGAAGTASGLSMLLSNANKGLKRIIGNIDVFVTAPCITRVFEMLVENGRIDAYHGDIKIVASGSSAGVEREQATLRRNEFLQIVIGSPLIQQIMGLPAIADLLRTHVRDLGIDADIPSGETIQRRAEAAAQAEAAALASASEAQKRQMLAHGAPQPGSHPIQKPQQALPSGAPAGGGAAALFRQPSALPVQGGQNAA